MAKIDFPEKRYATLEGGWLTCATLQEAVANSTNRVQVAEYQLVRVIAARMVVESQSEIA